MTHEKARDLFLRIRENEIGGTTKGLQDFQINPNHFITHNSKIFFYPIITKVPDNFQLLQYGNGVLSAVHEFATLPYEKTDFICFEDVSLTYLEHLTPFCYEDQKGRYFGIYADRIRLNFEHVKKYALYGDFNYKVGYEAEQTRELPNTFLFLELYSDKVFGIRYVHCEKDHPPYYFDYGRTRFNLLKKNALIKDIVIYPPSTKIFFNRDKSFSINMVEGIAWFEAMLSSMGLVTFLMEYMGVFEFPDEFLTNVYSQLLD